MRELLEIVGNYDVDQYHKRFTILVHAPEISPDGAHYCRVVTPEFCSFPRDIFGGSPRHAVEPACELIKIEFTALVAAQFSDDVTENGNGAVDIEEEDGPGTPT